MTARKGPVLLLIDLETTGLDPEKDQIIEVAMTLFDEGYSLVRETKSYLIDPAPRDDTFAIPHQVSEKTGLISEMLTGGESELTLVHDLQEYKDRVDYFVAHNHGFEKAFLEKLMAKYNSSLDVKWIDTMTDLPDYQGKSLSHIVGELGLSNPWPHRAFGDVLAMLRVLRSYDWDDIETIATAPKIQLVSCHKEEQREAAKDLGYKWNPDLKLWIKSVPDFMVDDQCDQANDKGFTARTIGEYYATPDVQMVIAFDYDETLVEKIRALGGWKFHKDGNAKYWHKTVKEFLVGQEMEAARAAGFNPLIPEDCKLISP